MITGIITWLILSIVIGIVGSNRKIGFTGSFFLSLLLSPIIGLIFTLTSKSLETERYEQELLKTQKLQQKTLEKINNQNLNSLSDGLKKVKDLLESGIVTTEEYEKMKASIITKFENSATEESLSANEQDILIIDNNNLTDLEKQRVEILKTKMQIGDVITKHQGNKKIEIMNIKNYEEWIRLYGEEIMTLIAKKE